MLNKKGAEESNVIIFIILALIVAGLVIYFSWNFFSSGTRLIDVNDPSVAIAVESCKYEISRQQEAYCNSARYVKIQGGGEMIVSCYFIDTAVRKGFLNEVYEKPSCPLANQAFKDNQCSLIRASGVSDRDLKKTIVDGKNCGEVLKALDYKTETSALPALSILEFKGSGNFEELSEEECRLGLEQRKKELEIPDNLCYWEAMTTIYDEKCENLDRSNISEIFDRKAEYRKLNNPDWSSLNIDEDFCVEVIYDCTRWKDHPNFSTDSESSTYGFFDPEIKKIYLNPYLEMNKDFVLSIFLHEGLHSIQSDSFLEKKTKDSFIGDGYEIYSRTEEEQKIILDFAFIKVSEMISKTERVKATCGINNLFANSLFEQGKISLEVRITMQNQALSCLKIMDTIESEPTISFIITPQEFSKTVSDIDSYLFQTKSLLEALKEQKKISWGYSDIQKDLGEIIGLQKEIYLRVGGDIKLKSYVGKKVEIDARLSEVHRYLLDQTAPNCEVIYTPERAKEVLMAFLDDPSADIYSDTRMSLKAIINSYEGTEYEEDIYNDLIGRLPGLASNTELNQDEMYS